MSQNHDVTRVPPAQQLDRGATLVEYMLLIALVVLAALVGLRELSSVIGGQYSSIGSSLTDAFNN